MVPGSIPQKTVERLILYRRNLLDQGQKEGGIFSHQLAKMLGSTPAQVRRDLMAIGYSGSPAHGYEIPKLIHSIGQVIDAEDKQCVALVGVGNIGRAILDYFHGRREKLDISVLFDIDPEKVNRVLHGIRCYHVDQMQETIREHNIRIGIITVPGSIAQSVAEQLTHAGVTGILNYAPVKLELPPDIYIENKDMTMSIEKVAYFARKIVESGART